MNAFTPVVMFVVLMGGIAFALSRDFSHLYPGHSGDPSGTTNNASKKSWIVETSDSEQDKEHEVSSKVTGHVDNVGVQYMHLADCSSNHKCAVENVTGICCPTLEGVQLECCN